ncbi:MAG: ATP-binding protein [Moorea sp. SIO2B7]|nr:ATP-binding protein [Moorena sp. SIO2B7]
MSQNPFFVGGPVSPEYFVGRTSEVRTAFNQISKRAHLAIYGSPGMGKSSLLQYLSSPEIWQQRGRDPSQAFIVYLNCTGIYPFTPSEFWREILSLLRYEAEDDPALESAIDRVLEEDTVESVDLRRILRKIGKQNKFMLLLLDDYDAALRSNDDYTEVQMLTFLNEFRDLTVHRREGRYLSTVVTTFRRLNELGPKLAPSGSPWYNHYLFQPLKPFSKAEINSLFFKSDAKLFIPISDKLRKGVLAITEGHPALLQNAGFLLYNKLQDGKIPNIQAFTRDFESQTEQFFRDTWRFSTDIEQVLLMMIALSYLEGRLNKRRYALGDIGLIFSQRSRELIDLEERGVIKNTIQEDKTVYAFTSSMMEWWVIREIENSNEEELKQREKIFLNLMSRAQAGQVFNVIRQVWKHREEVKSLISWITPILGV